jgi:OOP family OmpA-OmpF porin
MSKASSAALLAVTLAVLLPACERRSHEPQPTPTPSASTEAQKVSIIRPDVEPEAVPERPLAPLILQIGFGEGGAALSDTAIATLEEALASDQVNGGGAITLGGHSDSAGSDEANLAASRQRADAVREWLVEHGIAEDRITIIAFGEQNPIAPNALSDGTPDVAGRAKNRRVQVTVAPPPGGSPTPGPSDDTTLVDRISGEK